MINIELEMFPYGFKENKYNIGKIKITNDASGTKTIGHYDVVFYQKGGQKIWRQTRVENFPRLRLGIYDILFRALKNVCEERNKA
jgi:hypothetical protein